MSKRGFTLIELIVVIVLLGFITIKARPQLDNLPQTRAYFAIRKVQSDVRYAQLLAMETNARTRVVFDAAADSYQLDRETSPSVWTGVSNPSTKGTYSVTLNSGDYSGVDITGAAINATSTVIFNVNGAPFDGSGNALTEPSQIELNSKYQLRFRVETGKVDIVTL